MSESKRTFILDTVWTSGDVLPFLRLGGALVRAGHDVVLVSHAVFREKAEREGMRFAPIDEIDDYAAFVADNPLFNSPQGFVTVYRRHVLPKLVRETRAIVEQARGRDAVVVMRSTPGIAARFAQELAKTPIVPVFLAPSFASTLPVVADLIGSVLAEELQTIRQELELPPITDWSEWLAPPPTSLALWPKWFAPPSGTWPPDLRHVGFLRGQASPNEVARDAIVVTGGTGLYLEREFFVLAFEAAKRLGRRVVLIAAHGSLLPNELPSHVTWVDDFVDFAALLPGAAAIIHHGGIGTLGEALAAGIPQLVMGTGGDRADNAEHLVRLGVGAYVPPARWDGDRITTALERLLVDPTVKEACVRARADVLATDSYGLAVTALAGVRTEENPAAILAKLSPAKRKLLELRLAKQAKQANQGTAPSVLSFAQERFWLLQSLEPKSASYNIAITTRVGGPVDIARLERAHAALVARHESLRTTFRAVDGKPVLVIAETHAPVRRQRAGSLSEARDLAEAVALEPFSLEGALERMLLVTVSETEHVLLLVLHHSIGDGWSLGILTRELARLYLSSEPLPFLALSYADFARSQRERVTGTRLDALVAFWKQTLADVPTLSLPLDRRPPATRTGEGAVVMVAIPAPLRDRLDALGKQQGATLFMVMTAAYGVLLAALTRQTDFAIGTPVFGRSHADLEGVVGMFVNTVALRIDIGGHPSFETILGRVRAQVLAALEHQDLPFEKLVAALGVERDTKKTPIFQTILAFQNLPIGPVTSEGVTFENLPARRHAVEHDLSLEVSDRELRFEYAVDVLDRESVERIAGRFIRVLEGIATNRPTDWLTPEERTLLLADWQTRRQPEPSVSTLTALFARSVARAPDAIAVTYERESLSYRELDARASEVADKLTAGPEDLVAIRVSHPLRRLVAILGVLKAGAGYVPMDPSTPPERLSRILEIARPLVVIDDAFEYGPTDGTKSHRAPHPLGIAYVIFTSGSTGVPKGVAVQHAGAVLHAEWMSALLGLGPTDSTLQAASIAFDASVSEIFDTLAANARLVLLPDGATREPNRVRAVLAAERITMLEGIPAFLEAVVEDGSPLRAIISGAERLPRTTADALLERAPHAAIWNCYGPTEATIDATFARIGRTAREPTIGRGAAQTKIYVVDDGFELVPPGTPGELVLGGPGIARGYVGDPAQTAASFVPSPFAEGERVYRTGDLVRWVDAELEFLGRIDRQVKLRGMRIELEEIESALRSLAEVVSAAAVVVGGRLAAYVVLARPIEPRALADRLARSLPAPMVPTSFTVLEAMPLTTSGKIDRRALPAPELTGGYEFEASATERERMLVEVWSSVLGVPRIGVTDNFFELGGDSILVMQVVARARARGLTLTAKDVFEAQTIRALAGRTRHHVATVTAEIAGPIPLLPVQRMFFDEQATTEPNHYNQSVLVDIGPVDASRLESAFATLFDRHPALRHRFRREASGWAAHASERSSPPRVARHDDEEPAVVTAACAALQLELDIARGDLVRIALFAGHLLFVTIHHLAVDGVSWRILLDELQSLLAGAALAPVTTPVSVWARRLRELGDDEIPYWTKILAGADGPPLTLSAEVRELDRELPAPPNVKRSLRLGPEEVLLVALSRALRKWTGHASTIVDLEGHGRTSPWDDVDLSRTVGWLTTIHPVRLAASDDLSTDIASTKDALRNVPRRGLGFAALRARGGIAPYHAPVLFNYLGHGDGPDLALSTLDTGALAAASTKRTHALEINAIVLAGKLRIRATFDARSSDVSPLLDAFRDELEALARFSETGRALSPSDFALANLSQGELDAVAAEHDVEDIYPLTPLQQGMLLHALTTEGEDPYISVLTCRFDGLDVAAFQQAFDRLVERHAPLRTYFVWDGLRAPVQVVVRSRASSLEIADASIEERIAENRRRGIRQPNAALLVPSADGRSHRFLWTLHHAVADGWSTAQWLSELSASHAGETERASGPPFRDYVAWLAGRDSTADLAYWRSLLAGFRSPTPLAPARKGEPGRIECTIPKSRFEAALRELRITLSTLVQGAWGFVLGLHAGERDVVFGAATSGRSADIPGIERMTGLLINTIPVRVRRSEARVDDFLGRLQEEQSTSREHEHTALVAIKSCSEVPTETPLFHSVVVVENFPVQDATTGSLSAHDFRFEERSDQPLTLTVHPGATTRIAIAFDGTLVDRAGAKRYLDRFVGVFEAMAAGPSVRLGDVAWAFPDELDSVVLEGAAAPPTGSLGELLLDVCRATPDAIALVGAGESLTYRDLERRALSVAGDLLARGLSREEPVVIRLPRSIDSVIAMSGVLLAGGAFVNVDPGAAPQREHAILDLLRARFVLDALPADHAPPSRLPAVHPDSVAYVVFTSGSTGVPKGVAATHRATVNRLKWEWSTHPILADVFCQKTSLAFVDCIWEIFGPLLGGAKSVIVSDETLFDTTAFLDVLERESVTRLILVPSLLRVIVDANRPLPALRMCTSSGEPLSSDLAARFQRSYPHALLLNLYGSSEVAADATAHVVKAPEMRIPIGVPIAGLGITLRDEALDLVPPGALGEICVSGVGLARGYFGRPDATAEKFVPDPIHPGARLYRTGDLGVLDANGEIECFGRRDGQVKLRGVRIELGEVETALRAIDGVRDAVCQVRSDVLVAWIVGATTTRDGLREVLAERLPRAMLPTRIVFLDALPLNTSGKVDKRSLVEPVAASETEAPRSASEKVIAGIWAEVLGRSEIGAMTHFYDLGGHSLLAIRVLSRVRSAFRTTLDIKVFMTAMTVREQAGAVAAAWGDAELVEQIAETLLEVEGLSDEEIAARLR